MSGQTLELEEFIPYQLAVAAAEVSVEFSKKYTASNDLDHAQQRIICHLSELECGVAVSVCDLVMRAFRKIQCF